MSSMRAAYLLEPRQFELREVPCPVPGPHEALVRVARTGICGTDVHIFRGHYATEHLPLIPGHEFTGHIAELGGPVAGLEEGMACVVDMNIGCSRCYFCRRGETLNCPEKQQMGITVDGAFADCIIVPSRLVIPAPAKVTPNTLALTEPLACVVRSARKANVSFGQSAVVIGAGPIGNLHVQLLRNIGAVPIMVSDLSEDRVRMALEIGADFGSSDPESLHALVMKQTDGRGADLVIECVGDSALYETAQTLMRKGGHLAAFGLPGPDSTLTLPIVRTIAEENSLSGSVAGQGQDMHDALTLLAHGRICTSAFSGAEYALDHIQEAFDSIGDRPQDLKTQIVMN